MLYERDQQDVAGSRQTSAGHELSNVAQPQVQYLARRRSSSHWLLFCGLSLLLGGGAVYGWQFSWQSLQKRQPSQAQEQHILTAQTESVRIDGLASKEASPNVDAAAEPLKLATAQKIAAAMTANSEEFEPSATEGHRVRHQNWNRKRS